MTTLQMLSSSKIAVLQKMAIAAVAASFLISSFVPARQALAETWLPGEFEAQEAMWIQWPDVREPVLLRNWDFTTKSWYHDPQSHIDIFVRYVYELQTEGTVNIIVRDAIGEAQAVSDLGELEVPLGNVVFHQIPYDDTWALDNVGPFVIKDGALHMLNFGFDAWNDPDYGPYDLDDDVPLGVAAALNIGVTDVTYVDPTDGLTKPLIYEGGAFEASGEGTLVASWSVMFDRNPNLSRPEATRIMKEVTGAHTVIWIDASTAEAVGLAYGFSAWDHTDAYVKFYAPGKVAVGRTRWLNNSEAVNEARAKLEAAGWVVTDFSADWNFMNHVEFGNKVIAIYGNGRRLIGDGTAANAVKGKMELQKLYPDKEIIVYEGSVMVFMTGGGIHCISRWQPAL